MSSLAMVRAERRVALLMTLTLALSACGDPSPPTPAPATPDMTGQQDMGAQPQRDATADADQGQDQGQDQGDQAPDMALSDELTLPPEPWDIKARGPYQVGYRTSTLTYRAAPGDRERTLEIVVWYPSLQRTGRRARYMRLLARPEVFQDAKIAPEGVFPVLVFSHGNSSLAEQSYFMTEHFASHGWIVVAPYHTNNTVRDNEGSINYRSALDRPQDITATLDWLMATPEDDPLHGRFTDQIALSGHSFGGYTTMASSGAQFAVDWLVEECAKGAIERKFCELFSKDEELAVFRQGFLDSRIKAAIPQTPAGASFFREGASQITIPTMIMTGARDRSLTNEEEGDPIWVAMAAKRGHVRLDFKQAGHFTFSNMCELLGGVAQVRDDGCDGSFIPIERAFPIINHYALAFARKHLLGDDSHDELLSGQAQPYAQDVVHMTK